MRYSEIESRDYSSVGGVITIHIMLYMIGKGGSIRWSYMQVVNAKKFTASDLYPFIARSYIKKVVYPSKVKQFCTKRFTTRLVYIT